MELYKLAYHNVCTISNYKEDDSFFIKDKMKLYCVPDEISNETIIDEDRLFLIIHFSFYHLILIE